MPPFYGPTGVRGWSQFPIIANRSKWNVVPTTKSSASPARSPTSRPPTLSLSPTSPKRFSIDRWIVNFSDRVEANPLHPILENLCALRISTVLSLFVVQSRSSTAVEFARPVKTSVSTRALPLDSLMCCSFPAWETFYCRAFNDSTISSCSGKRPASAFENTCSPSAMTIKTPPSPLMSSGATPSSFSRVSAKLTALG